MRVADFIVGNDWDMGKLRRVLLEVEVEDITSIPICNAVEEDELIWHYAKDGVYSVKLGYAYIRWFRDQNVPTTSNNVKDPLWRNIWRLQVPPKVRSFLWRCCTGALPSVVNLMCRIKEIDPTCCRYKWMTESYVHALLTCPASQHIWENFGIQVEEQWGNVNSIEDWLRRVCEDEIEDEINRNVMLLWAIWNERNKIFHGGEGSSPRGVIDNTIRYLTNYHATIYNEEDTRKREGSGFSQRWSTPPEGAWKINLDAAKFDGIGSGIGVVIRNHAGEVECAAVKQIRHQWSVYIIEAKAAIFGISLAIQRGFRTAILESDSLQLITMLNTRKFPSSYLGKVAAEITEASSIFDSISFNFVKRGGNEAAHMMAHYVPLEFTTRVWVDVCPESIANIVASDFVSSFT